MRLWHKISFRMFSILIFVAERLTLRVQSQSREVQINQRHRFLEEWLMVVNLVLGFLINSLLHFQHMEIMVAIEIEDKETDMKIAKSLTNRLQTILEMITDLNGDMTGTIDIKEIIETETMLEMIDPKEEITEVEEMRIMTIEETIEPIDLTLAHLTITVEEIEIIEGIEEDPIILDNRIRKNNQKKKEIDRDQSLINDCMIFI